MQRLNLLTYGSLINRESFKKLVPDFGEYVIILGWLNGHMRFLGAANPGVVPFEQMFDEQGNLLVKEVGTATIERSKDKDRCNVVIYTNIPEEKIRLLDEALKKINLDRTPMDDFFIKYYHGEQFNSNLPTVTYVARLYGMAHGNPVPTVRDDILPNLEYLQKLRSSAQFYNSVSDGRFAEDLDSTTYLPDKRTTVAEHSLANSFPK